MNNKSDYDYELIRNMNCEATINKIESIINENSKTFYEKILQIRIIVNQNDS